MVLGKLEDLVLLGGGQRSTPLARQGQSRPLDRPLVILPFPAPLDQRVLVGVLRVVGDPCPLPVPGPRRRKSPGMKPDQLKSLIERKLEVVASN